MIMLLSFARDAATYMPIIYFEIERQYERCLDTDLTNLTLICLRRPAVFIRLNFAIELDTCLMIDLSPVTPKSD